MTLFTDVSYANLPDRVSSTWAYAILLCGKGP